jgi:AcrR family transcriptional regulator
MCCGSKEELQLATVDAARERFAAEVVVPALSAAEPGRELLLALCEGYLNHVERRVFPGGCLFVAASAELGARSGRLHDRVAAYQREWRTLLATQAQAAYEHGALPADTDPGQLAFELGAILAGANILSVLHDDDGAIERARSAVRARVAAER